MPPETNERPAWKDTIKTYPGYVTRVIQRFDLPAGTPTDSWAGIPLCLALPHPRARGQRNDATLQRDWLTMNRRRYSECAPSGSGASESAVDNNPSISLRQLAGPGFQVAERHGELSYPSHRFPLPGNATLPPGVLANRSSSEKPAICSAHLLVPLREMRDEQEEQRAKWFGEPNPAQPVRFRRQADASGRH